MPLSPNDKPTPFQELRSAVNQLPRGTAAAMLEGVRRGEIIAGKYVGPRGDGMCPLVAARRSGAPVQQSGRVFPPAWDRYVGIKTDWAGRTAEVRAARPEQISLLVSLLEARLFPQSELSLSAASDRCHSCDRPEQIDLYGDCAFCAAPLVRAPQAAPQPAAAPARAQERELQLA